MDKVLVVAAHPDDEVLGCGGTIPRLISKGHEVHVLILGDGVTSRELGGPISKSELGLDLEIAERKKNCIEALRILGAKDPLFFTLPDNRFDTLSLLYITRIVEGVVEDIKPGIVFTHSRDDLNVDHQLAFRAVLTSVRPVPGSCVKELYEFEVPSSTEWTFDSSKPFSPNVFIDITETLTQKIRAFSLYKGEVRDFPHPRSEEYIRHLASVRGSTVGVSAAEAFRLVWSVR